MTPDQARRLADEATLLELEAQVIAAEAAAGWSVPRAARPLHPWEQAASVRFADLDRTIDQAAGLIGRALRDLHTAAVVALLADLADLSSPAAVLERLTRLLSPSDAATLAALDVPLAAAARLAREALLAAHRDAAGAAVAEAARQGVPDRLLPQPGQLAPQGVAAAALDDTARFLADSTWARVLTIAAREARTAVTPGTTVGAVLDAVRSSVEAAADTATLDEPRQAATRAVNDGRRSVALAVSVEPQEVYASELLDGRTCGPCAAVDGRMYESLESALVDYPSGGSFRDCKGGSRCRGTLVFVWPSEAAPSLDQGPFDRVGRFPVDRTPRGPASTGTVPGRERRPGAAS